MSAVVERAPFARVDVGVSIGFEKVHMVRPSVGSHAELIFVIAEDASVSKVANEES